MASGEAHRGRYGPSHRRETVFSPPDPIAYSALRDGLSLGRRKHTRNPEVHRLGHTTPSPGAQGPGVGRRSPAPAQAGPLGSVPATAAPPPPYVLPHVLYPVSRAARGLLRSLGDGARSRTRASLVTEAWPSRLLPDIRESLGTPRQMACSGSPLRGSSRWSVCPRVRAWARASNCAHTCVPACVHANACASACTSRGAWGGVHTSWISGPAGSSPLTCDSRPIPRIG